MHFTVDLWDSLIFLSMYDCVYAYHVLLSAESEARAICTNFLLLLANYVTVYCRMHLLFPAVLLFHLLLSLSLFEPSSYHGGQYSSCILAFHTLFVSFVARTFSVLIFLVNHRFILCFIPREKVLERFCRGVWWINRGFWCALYFVCF